LRLFGFTPKRLKIGSSGFVSGCTCKLPSHNMKAVEDLEGSNKDFSSLYQLKQQRPLVISLQVWRSFEKFNVKERECRNHHVRGLLDPLAEGPCIATLEDK
jgi:hypothetical protein